MKLFRGQEGFYNLITEALKHPVNHFESDYYQTSGQFITTVYESTLEKFIVVDDTDNGVFYSVEKIDIK